MLIKKILTKISEEIILTYIETKNIFSDDKKINNN